MEVTVDQLWATPSTVHVRVIVFGPDRRWRHKYHCSIPVDEIPEEALRALQVRHDVSRCNCDECQPALFEV